MSDLKHPKEIYKLYYNEEISISEALRLWDVWEKSTEEEKRENATYIKILAKKAAKTNNKISDLSEKKPLAKILKVNRKTSGWITYLGWVVLIGAAFYIMIALSSFA